MMIENPLVNLLGRRQQREGALGRADLPRRRRQGAHRGRHLRERLRARWRRLEDRGGALLSAIRRPLREGWINWGGGDLPIVPYHFTVDTSGIPIPPATGAAPQTKATLADLQKRVDRLNDEDRIRNLQSAYGYYEDRKMWDDVVDLFAQDGVVEIGGQGVWRGKAGVRRWLESMGPAGLRTVSSTTGSSSTSPSTIAARRQGSVGARHRARHARRGGPGEGLVGGRGLPQPLRQRRRRVEDPRDAPLPAHEDRRLPGLGQEPDRRQPWTCPRSSARIR